MSSEYMDIEFSGDSDGVGYYEVGGWWGGLWKGIKKISKAVYKSKATRAAAAMALNSVAPGSGEAFKKSIDLIDKATSKDPKTKEEAIKVVKDIADKAKAGDKKFEPLHQMLVAINDGRKEAKSDIAIASVGAAVLDTVISVKTKDGQILRMRLSQAKKFLKKNKGAKVVPDQTRPLPPARGPKATPQQIQQAIQRTPPAKRGALAQRIVQASLPPQMQQQYADDPGYPDDQGYADEGDVDFPGEGEE